MIVTYTDVCVYVVCNCVFHFYQLNQNGGNSCVCGKIVKKNGKKFIEALHTAYCRVLSHDNKIQ